MKSKNNRLRIKIVSFVVIIAILIGAATYIFLIPKLKNNQPVNYDSVADTPVNWPDQQTNNQQQAPPVTNTEESNSAITTWPKVYNLEESSSISVVVNKKHRLPAEYEPVLVSFGGGLLRQEASEALSRMFDDASALGYSPKMISAYRSYGTQEQVYSNYVASYGQAEADTFSARPGHSEHQTGLAVDVGDSVGGCDLEICFENTSFGAWVQTNAHFYGFIVRYPNGKESLTGYQYEPWHLRYIEVNTATQIFNSGQTLDQYYGVEAGGY